MEDSEKDMLIVFCPMGYEFERGFEVIEECMDI